MDNVRSANHVAAHTGLRFDRWFILLVKFSDGAAVACALVVSVALYRAVWSIEYSFAALLAAALFILFAEVGGVYRFWQGEIFKRQFFRIIYVWIATFFALLLLAYAIKTSTYFSRVTIGIWLVSAPVFLSGWRIIARILFRRLMRHDHVMRKVAIWGAGDVAEQLVGKIKGAPWLGLHLTEYVRDEGVFEQPQRKKCKGFDSIQQCLEMQAKRGDFDILYIALPAACRSRIVDLIDRLADTTVSVYMVPDYFTTSLFHGKWSDLEGIPLVSVYDMPFWGVDGWVKRLEDVLLSSLFLLIAAVPMLLIVLGVKLSSPGPVLFKQRRYGMDGKEISVLKFRSMRVCDDEANVPQAKRHDPRVTWFGYFLRRTSLDELPQFINVLKGDMSLVGPRPHAVAHNELYRKRIKGYMLRHKVRPGITGWAQVNGWRGETETLSKMENRVEYDLWYIRNWSLWLDLKIILLTMVCGFTGKYAY